MLGRQGYSSLKSRRVRKIPFFLLPPLFCPHKSFLFTTIKMPLIEDLGTVRATGSARFYSYSNAPVPNSTTTHTTGTSRGKRAATFDRNRFTDNATRQRAVKRRVAELERENYNEQHLRLEIPRIDVTPGHSIIAASEAQGFPNRRRPAKSQTSRSGSTPATRRILASRKTLSNLLDDDPPGAQALLNLSTPPARYPLKHLCGICGFQGVYVCIRCGLRYCSLKCDSTHKETRCLKTYG